MSSPDATPLHATLADGRWWTMSVVEQMANVGSEVERAIAAYSRGQDARWERALARALELFDFTATDPRWSFARRREILRAREELCLLFFGDVVPTDSAARQRKYFLQFALAARHRANKA